MSTITREFTKEQLIEVAQEIVNAWVEITEREPDSRYYGIRFRLAKIALASLEAKSRKLFTCSGCGAEGLDEPLESKCHCNEDGAHWIEGVVYTAPTAPVSVPDENGLLPCPCCGGNAEFDYDDDNLNWISCNVFGISTDTAYHTDVDARDKLREVWNRRAAMLQGADGNSPVIPDGWVMVPVEPTMAMLDEFDSIIDYGAEDSRDAWCGLIAAAPQLEVK